MTNDPSISDDFESRHIGPGPHDVRAMLETIGVASLDELIAQTIPDDIRQRSPLDLGTALSEIEALAKARELAAHNVVLTSLIGQGYYGTILPPVIQRNILENPAWYTAYTPYQPEISQGRLEALLNFQTMIADLTALDIANASLLDEATAAAEAMAMAQRISQSERTVFFADRDCHPQTLAVLQTRAEALGWQVVIGDPMRDIDPAAIFGALFQYPGTFGEVRDFREPIARLRAAGAISVVAADPLALTLLKPPGELGADIAVGSTQRFGVPMGYGGPHAAYIATRDVHKRALPGRLVGVSVDSRGNKAYRLALQTREQHIRREKATSNICTAQVLLAVIASMYAVYHGPEGLQAIARRVHATAARLKAGLVALGWSVRPSAFFDTITVEVGERREAILARAVESGINLRDIPSCHGTACIGISCDETTTMEVVQRVWCAFGDSPAKAAKRAGEPAGDAVEIPAGLLPRQQISDPSGLPPVSLGDRAAALHAPACRLRSCARPVHDSARVLHHEAQRYRRNDSADLAGIRQSPSVCAGVAGQGLRRRDRRARYDPAHDHGLRCDFVPAQFRRAGRICGSARNPRISSQPRRGASHGLSDSRIRARHQSRLRPHGGHGGRGGGLRQQRKHRPGPIFAPRRTRMEIAWLRS